MDKTAQLNDKIPHPSDSILRKHPFAPLTLSVFKTINFSFFQFTFFMLTLRPIKDNQSLSDFERLRELDNSKYKKYRNNPLLNSMTVGVQYFF